MALTRNFLKSMGLTDEQVSAIIEGHTDTVTALTKERDDARASAAKVEELTRERDDYKTKYEKAGDASKVQAEFDAYKQKVEGEKRKEQEDKDIAAIVKEAGVERESFQRLIQNSFDRQSIKRGADGAITNRAELVEAVRTQNPDCITTTKTKGTPPANPPAGGGKGMTKDQILAIKDPAEQRMAIAQNLDLFNK